MKSRVSAFAALILLLAACSSSTTGTGGGVLGADGKHPTGGQCAGATSDAAATCSGQVCISLNPNKENKTGICSESCANGTCTKGGSCVDVPGKGPYCFQTCTSDASCVDGFACVDTGDGATKVCLVNANGTGTSPDAGTTTGGTDPCAAVDCVVSTDTTGYCSNAPTAKRVCDCPGPAPAAPCVAAAQGANLYCCP